MTLSSPSTRCASEPIPIAPISRPHFGYQQRVGDRLDAERHPECALRPGPCTGKGDLPGLAGDILSQPLADKALLGLTRPPRDRCHSTECDPRIAHRLSLEL